jgi:hypothetical protein
MLDINLVPWLVLWAVVTTVDAAVVLYRLKLTSHEVMGIRIDDTEANLPHVQEQFSHVIRKFDTYVKWLTVVSVVLLSAITAVWLYQLFMKAY